MSDEVPGSSTDSVHAGGKPDPATGARAQPIYQTSSYVFDSAADAAERYALASDENIYSRMSNPTVRTLEERLATMHGGTDAVATASGMAALDAATFVLAEPGDSIVTASDIYGGTATYFRHAADRRHIEPAFVETTDLEAWKAAIDDTTAYAHVETIGNPSLVTPSFEAIAEIAHDAGVPLLVDNTFATPCLCRPLDHGADLVWASTTKWIHGGGTTLGGILVEGGDFDWDADRHPEIAGENRAYHDITFAEDFPDAPVSAATRFRSLRSLGAAQSPIGAWLTLQGLETLPLRMARHSENAAIVAEFLEDHSNVNWVRYPTLDSHPTAADARRYLPSGAGGMVTFGPSGGYEAAKRICEETELFSFLANVGDTKSLITHPASTTHGQLSAAEQEAAGVTRELIRLSVGIEEPADLLADLDRALEIAHPQ